MSKFFVQFLLSLVVAVLQRDRSRLATRRKKMVFGAKAPGVAARKATSAIRVFGRGLSFAQKLSGKRRGVAL